MRVLHLVDQASPQATPTSLALLGDALGRLGDLEQSVLLLGGTTLRAAAESAGIRDAMVLGVPGGRAPLGYFALQRRLRELGKFDLIHCWTLGAFAAAALLARDTPRVLSVTMIPAARPIRWLRVLCGMPGTAAVLAVSNTVRRELLTAGVAEKLVHVLRPSIDLSRVRHGQRDELRRQWSAHEDDRIVALLSDPPALGDANKAVFALSLAAESYERGERKPDTPSRFKLLIHPDSRFARRAVNGMHGIGRPDRLIFEPRLDRPWDVLPGCDAAIALGPEGGNLALLWAMAGNVPIVAEATYASSEVVEDRHSALLAKPDVPRLLAQRLRHLFDQRQLAWQLRDTARHEAFSFFSRQRYCEQVRLVYEQVAAGLEVSIPPIEATGGMRFAGRA